VTNNVSINGVSLTGMTETQARAAITTNTVAPSMLPKRVYFGYTKRTLYGQAYVSANVSAMVEQAFSTVTTDAPYAIKPVWTVNSKGISAWVAKYSKLHDRKAVNASRYVKNRKIYVKNAQYGRRVNQKAAASALYKSVVASTATSGTPQTAYRVPVVKLTPKITNKKLGKAILVVLGKRTGTLTKVGTAKTEVRYRCAVGMKRYPTPKGTWKIVGKNPHPGWTNPGSDWAKNMPSYIPPGPSNPLGLRALYLNAPGIRIHGTSNTSSIGTAASHGCIRLKNSDVVKLYPRVPVGTVVYIVK
jgi:lipoprotein-anchoring transpeptidase ErfK/SrfK